MLHFTFERALGKQVNGIDLEPVFPAYKTLLRDDLAEDLDPYEFEKRLRGMYASWAPQALSLPLRERGVDERVVVRTFHAWCQDMVRTYQLDKPKARHNTDAYYEELATIVQRALDTGLVPSGQYTALLIDEAHDFQDAWLQMAAKLVTPSTHSLLVLYDDAQSIYPKKRRKFNFASVGIDARGRTGILRLNYRNTAEILALAMQCAQGLVSEKAESDNEMQTVHPSTAGNSPIVQRVKNSLEAVAAQFEVIG